MLDVIDESILSKNEIESKELFFHQKYQIQYFHIENPNSFLRVFT